MESSQLSVKPWQIAAFPLVIGWQPEYWSLPLYFPDLVVGLCEGQPEGTGLQSVPLPPRNESLSFDWRNYRPGELQQWKAYLDYKASAEEDEEELDLIHAIKGEPAVALPEPPQGESGVTLPKLLNTSATWTVAWQLEKMVAEQEAGLREIQRHQAKLDAWLAPEPWEEAAFRPPVDLDPRLEASESPDPELALLRLYLWRAVLGPHLTPPWAPLILAAPARFAPDCLPPNALQSDFTLPGCQTREDLHQAQARLVSAGLESRFSLALSEVLEALTQNHPDRALAQGRLADLIEQQLRPAVGITPGQPSITLEIYLLSEGYAGRASPFQEIFPGPILQWRGHG